MNFFERLDLAVGATNSLLCIGLDSDITKIPEPYRSDPSPQFSFNRHIIEETSEFASAFKPNIAFYEGRGPQGIAELIDTCSFIRTHAPDRPIILDAKRGDIDSTNVGYVKLAFDVIGADAITLNPYLGQEALQPFLKMDDKGFFVLCRTSNKGAGEFQDKLVDGVPLYQFIARRVSEVWNTKGNCGLVAGATNPDELRQVRSMVGDMTLLVPGIGAQGGEVKETVEAGQNSKGAGMVINVSRGVIFNSDPREAAQNYRDQINMYRKT